MKPLKIAHFSDTHLGYRGPARNDLTGRNQRTVDVERAYNAAIDDMLTRDLDLVIHSGDLFHIPRPSYIAEAAAIRGLRRLVEAGIEVVVIAGNHDTPRLRSSSSVFTIMQLAVEGVHFVAGYEGQVIRFPELDLDVTAVPHGQLMSPELFGAFPTPGVRNILVAHGMLPGVKVNNYQHESGEEDVPENYLQPGYDYIALGHLHEFQRINSHTWYCGATERIGWADAPFTPGYALVELGDPGTPPEVIPVHIPTRPMYRMPTIQAANKGEMEILGEIESWLVQLNQPDAMVRVELEGASRSTRRSVELLVREDLSDLAWLVEIRVAQTGSIFASHRSSDMAMGDIRGYFESFIKDELETGRISAEVAEALRSVGWQQYEQFVTQFEEESQEGAA